MHMTRWLQLLLPIAALLVVLGTACAQDAATASPPTLTPEPSPTASPTPGPESRLATAESLYLPKLAPELATSIRAQPWYNAMEREHLHLIAAIVETERAATPRGERTSVAAAFEYATAQGWYADGLSGDEALKLRSVFQTYTTSLSDRRLPQIGPVLATTIAFELVEIVELPESGHVAVLVSADDGEIGRVAVDMAVRWLPEIEAVTGAFPYSFIHITVTELHELFAGLSHDEFIAISPDFVDDETMIHELTHSTLYGVFPTWFEEGFAHFMEYHLTGQLDEGEAYFREQLALLNEGAALDITEWPMIGVDLYANMVDRSRGFLFMKSMYEIVGTDEVVETIRALRTKRVKGQELIRHLVDASDPEQRAAMRSYVCNNVVGTQRDYCN